MVMAGNSESNEHWLITMVHRLCCRPVIGLGYIPVLLAISLAVTVGVSYLIAVLHGDVAVVFPYISDTGRKPPESCVFGQLVNLASLVLLALVYIRYKEIDTIEGLPPQKVGCLNKAGLIIGVIASLGLTVVGNFQDSNVLIVHDVGAYTMFVCATIYCVIHTRISYLLQPGYTNLLLCRTRFLLTCLLVVSLVLPGTVTDVLAETGWRKHHNHSDTTPLWKPTDGGYQFHVVSAIFEWMVTFTFGFYGLTFYKDFKRVTLKLHMFLHVEPFQVRTHEVQEPNEYTSLYA